MSINREKLGQLPLALVANLATEYLENKDIRSFFQTSKTYHPDRLRVPHRVWKNKLLASGCKENMLEAVINQNVIRDYQRLYEVFTSLHPIIRAQINKPWQLLCLSGEVEAINYAFADAPREILAESQWYFPKLFLFDQKPKLLFNTRQLIVLSCSPKGINFAASHPQLKKLQDGIKENIDIALFSGSSPALRFFFNSLSSREQKAYRKARARKSDLLIALQSGCSELMRILQPHILPLRTHHRLNFMRTTVTAALASGSKNTLYEVMKFWFPSLQPTEFETLNLCDIKTFPYNPLPGIVLSGNVSLLNSVLHDPKFKPLWKLTSFHRGLNLIDLAAISGHVKMIEYVFENFKECNPFHVAPDNWTVLYCAVQSRSLESVQKVLSLIQNDPRFAALPTSLANGHNIFHMAALLGAADILEFLFNEFKIIELTPSFDLLRFAVASGSIDTVIKLRQLFHQRLVVLDLGVENNDGNDILRQTEAYPYILTKPTKKETYRSPNSHITLLKQALSLPLHELHTFYQRPLLKEEKKPTVVNLKHLGLLIVIGLLMVASLAAGGVIPLTFSALAVAVAITLGATLIIGGVGRCVTSSLASAHRKRILKAAAAPSSSGNNYSLSSIPLVSPRSTHAQVNTSIPPLSSSTEVKRTSTADPFAAKGSGSSLPAPNMFRSPTVLTEEKENKNDDGNRLGLGLGGERHHSPRSSISSSA